MSWFSETNPGFVLIIIGTAAFLPPRGAIRSALIVLAPLLGLALLGSASFGEHGRTVLMGMELVTYRYDAQSAVFAIAAFLAQFIWALFSWNRTKEGEDAAALVQSGAAIAAILAGDLVSFAVLYGLWTLSYALTPLVGRSSAGFSAALRSLVLLAASWVIMLAGVILWAKDSPTGLHFGEIGLHSMSGQLLLLAFLVAAGVPFLNAWIVDGLSSARGYGAAGLAPFAGKIGIYALMRAFSGEGWLLYIGAATIIIGAICAVAERDLRRAVAHGVVSSLGLMILGIGLGDPFGVPGTGAYVFAHSLGILITFMALAEVEYRQAWSAERKIALQGAMPLIGIAAFIGGASVAGLPGLAGFASLAMLHAASDGAPLWALFALLVFPAAALTHASLRVPIQIFFRRNKKNAALAPQDRLALARIAGFPQALAFGLASFACLYLGFQPDWLLNIAANKETFDPFSGAFLIVQLQILGAASVAYLVLRPILTPDRALASRLMGLGDWIDGPGLGIIRWTRNWLRWSWQKLAVASRDLWQEVTTRWGVASSPQAIRRWLAPWEGLAFMVSLVVIALVIWQNAALR